MPMPHVESVPDDLGVDFGIVDLAADRDGRTYAGGPVNGLVR